MKIEIDVIEKGGITVRCGEWYQDHLGRDEALWAVAALLMNGENAQGYLRTAAEHEAIREYLARPLEPLAVATEGGAS